MKTLGNILWHFPFFWFVSAFFTFILGWLLVLTVIASPIWFGLIELSKFLLFPFSNSMISKNDLNIIQNKIWGTYGLLIRIIYFPFGLILAIITIFQIWFLFITIIWIPVALVLAKSISTYFNPVNKKCVSVSVANELENRRAKEFLINNY